MRREDDGEDGQDDGENAESRAILYKGAATAERNGLQNITIAL